MEEKDDCIKLLKERSLLKQDVHDLTQKVFEEFKKVIEEKLKDFRKQIPDERVRLKYDHNGDFEVHAYVGSDVLVFNMHSNVFSFQKEHSIWKSSYVKEDSKRAYCGIINVYNFLADSFLHNRLNDAGYLLGRIFINIDNHFMVEGKDKMGFLFKDFRNSEFNREAMKSIFKIAVGQAAKFDLHTPTYEKVSVVNVKQIKAQTSLQEMQTGKRLGFRFEAEQ